MPSTYHILIKPTVKELGIQKFKGSIKLLEKLEDRLNVINRFECLNEARSPLSASSYRPDELELKQLTCFCVTLS